MCQIDNCRSNTCQCKLSVIVSWKRSKHNQTVCCQTWQFECFGGVLCTWSGALFFLMEKQNCIWHTTIVLHEMLLVGFVFYQSVFFRTFLRIFCRVFRVLSRRLFWASQNYLANPKCITTYTARYFGRKHQRFVKW